MAATSEAAAVMAPPPGSHCPAEHTPGPWAVRSGYLIDGIGHKALAEIRGYSECAGANALLIAAAPELFDALIHAEQALLAAYGEPANTSLESRQGRDAILRARRALARAKGQPQ